MISASDLKARFNLTEAEFESVRRYGRIVMGRLDEFIGHFYDGWLRFQPEYKAYFGEAERLGRVQRMQTDTWRDFFTVDFDDGYVARRRRIGEVHARIGLPLPAYFAAVDQALRIFTRQMYDGSLTPDGFAECERAMMRLLHAETTVVVDAYFRMNQQTIADQTRTLVEMSTPVATLWDDILMLPIVGLIDSKRANDIMTSALRRISETRAKVFIMDISGVSVIDTAVANHLIQVTRATRLMGCQSLLSGVSPAIAQTMVELGIDVGSVQTKTTLRDALEDAFRNVGVMVQRI